MIRSLIRNTFFLFILITIGCKKDDIDPNKIRVLYSVMYDKPTDITKVSATFMIKSDNGYREIILKKSKYIRFNSEDLKYNGSSYTKDFHGFIHSGFFEWKDANKKIYINRTGPIASANMPAMTNFQRSVGLDLFWIGDTLGPIESVSVRITDWRVYSIVRSVVLTGSDHVSFNPADIDVQDLNDGSGSIDINRGKSFNIQEGTEAGGEIYISYADILKSINISN